VILASFLRILRVHILYGYVPSLFLRLNIKDIFESPYMLSPFIASSQYGGYVQVEFLLYLTILLGYCVE
jgi:hypothetical protein